MRFWFCQLVGWAGYSIATFFSITLIDGNVSWLHVAHILVSAGLGIATSWPLRPLYRSTFDLPIWVRLCVGLVAVVLLSALWTALRMGLFAWIVSEPPLWDEYNYWFFGSLSIFLSWSVLYYAIRYYELLRLEHQKLLQESALKEREHLRRLEAESMAREAQLRMLRYQLNPHFLFNTLNAINALVKLGENDKAREMLQRLSDFLRHTLDQDVTENVSLERELDSLKLYLDIEKTRFEDRLSLDFDIQPEARQALVPSLILQPLLENSMKYAIAASEEGGSVGVKASVGNQELRLEVSDTGPGMDELHSVSGRGVGLRNVLDRLETLYGSTYSFETADRSPSGLSIKISFPFQAAPAGAPAVAGGSR